jgi:hypothetical protein
VDFLKFFSRIRLGPAGQLTPKTFPIILSGNNNGSLAFICASLWAIETTSDAMALALGHYMFTLAPVSPFDISTQFILTKRPSSNHPHFWLMSMLTMMIKESLFSVMIAYAVCLLLLLSHWPSSR